MVNFCSFSLLPRRTHWKYISMVYPSPTEKIGGLTPSLWKIRSLPCIFLEPQNLHQYRLFFFFTVGNSQRKSHSSLLENVNLLFLSVLHSGIMDSFTSDTRLFSLYYYSCTYFNHHPSSAIKTNQNII